MHEHAPWLAGSPDGLVGTEGMVEAKCPYWNKTPHQTIPLYYYMQVNLCLECANREWCDYISWTPNAYKVIRVTRDRALHESMLLHYLKFFNAMSQGDGPPPVRRGEIQEMFTVCSQTPYHIILITSRRAGFRSSIHMLN